MPLLLSLALACTPDVRGLYAAERARALATDSVVPPSWAPDVRVDIAAPALADAARASLDVALRDLQPVDFALPLGLNAELTPRLRVEGLAVEDMARCETCITTRVSLAGTLGWRLAGTSGDLPLRVDTTVGLAADVVDATRVRARVEDVDRVTVSLGRIEGLRLDPAPALKDAVRAAIARKAPPVVLGDLADAEMPLRAVRLRTRAGSLQAELLTDVPVSATVPDAPPPARGIRVRMADSVVTALARRAALQEGPVALDVVVDPRGIQLDADALTLDVRLWRLVGRGWWRDYRARGTLAVTDGKVKLGTVSADEVGSSKGSGFVDPLAALAQGRIVAAIEEALTEALPASTANDAGSVRMTATATRISGAAGVISIEGTLDVRAPGRTDPAPRASSTTGRELPRE